MFNFIETKSYDVNRGYGTDWVTEYIFESDNANLTIDEALEKLKPLGYNPAGLLELSKTSDKYILKAVMY